MNWAADLHLHSRYAEGVSPAMTLENIARAALYKGVDLLGTGDCLQEDWLAEVEQATEPAEPGWWRLRPEVEERVQSRVPEKLRRPLRFVLSTEVDCLPPPKAKFSGLHHLIYFPSFEDARSFAAKLRTHGDLSAGRPTVNLSPRALLERVLAHGEDCHFAPAHVFNPWFSDLGTVGGEDSLRKIYGDQTPALLAVETGLTSTPAMCRRVSALDGHALFSCSDAHSLGNLGREYTVVDIEPGYRALFAALRDGSRPRVVRTVKYPLHHTRYFLNWCSECREPFDAKRCPRCERPLTTGSRDRLEQIADRPAPVFPLDSPAFQQLLPLGELVAQLLKSRPENTSVRRIVRRLFEMVGHERFVLCDAPESILAEIATSQLARAIVAQRAAPTEYFQVSSRASAESPAQQSLLELG